MSEATVGWIVIAGTASSAFAAKAWGPAFLGGRTLPRRVELCIRLFAPALLATLVTTQLFVVEGRLGVDERVVGVGVGVVLFRLRVPPLVVIAAAAVTTALLR